MGGAGGGGGGGGGRFGFCAVRADDAGEGLGGDAQGRRPPDQPIDLVRELGERRGGGGDHGAPPPPEVDQALVAEALVGVQDGVLIDVEGGGHVAGGRQTIAGRESTGEDVGTHRGGHLVVERERAVDIDADEHGTSLP